MVYALRVYFHFSVHSNNVSIPFFPVTVISSHVSGEHADHIKCHLHKKPLL